MDNYPNKTRDKWDKWDIILKPAGALITAITIGFLGFLSSSYLNRRQNIEMRTRLYTELINQREQSESSLRKDMFTSIIDTFLNQGAKPPSLKEKILNLELLAYNFHESLNLQPLFLDIEKEIIDAPSIVHEEYLSRLHRIAKEIVIKQKGILEPAGDYFDRRIELHDVLVSKIPINLENGALTLNGIERDFKISIQRADPKTKELLVRLEIKTLKDSGLIEEVEQEFWVGFFDFPMIDNTRLSHDQRCAIVLNKFETDVAEITTLFFPGSHASLREKPYYEELIKELIGNGNKSKSNDEPN